MGSNSEERGIIGSTKMAMLNGLQLLLLTAANTADRKMTEGWAKGKGEEAVKGCKCVEQREMWNIKGRKGQ